MKLRSIIIALLAIPSRSLAAMSCGSSFIHVGNSAGTVLKECGEPQYKTTTKIGLSFHEEVWYYDFGSNTLPHTVTVRNGKVIKFEVD